MAGLIFFLLGVTGLVLVAGIYGPRRDDHPLCIKCGHDLFGSYPNAKRCAECGADVTSRRSVRLGNRRRRPALIVLAILTGASSVGVSGWEAWQWASTTDWQAKKPVWWLIRSAHSDAAESQEPALTEILRRIELQKIDTNSLVDLAQTGLAHQADTDEDWLPLWGSVIEKAIELNLLRDEQVETYLDGAVSFTLAARPGPFGNYNPWESPYAPSDVPIDPLGVFSTRQWECIELALSPQWNRGSSKGRFEATCDVLDVSIGDEPLPLPTDSEADRTNWITLAWAYRYDETIVPSIPIAVVPGEYDVHARVHVEIFLQTSRDTPLQSLDLNLAVPIVVQPPAFDATELVTDAASSETLRQAIKIEFVGLRHMPDRFGGDATAPGLICSMSTGKTSFWGFGDSDASCPFNASMEILAYADSQYIGAYSVSLPNTDTYSGASQTDITSLDLVVRPDTQSRSMMVQDRKTGKYKPIWMGPEFKMHVDDVRWFDSVDDPNFPRKYRDLFRPFPSLLHRPAK